MAGSGALSNVPWISLPSSQVKVTGPMGRPQPGVGNLIEPRLMGRKLHLSPLVIILSLAFWSMLWGVVGMILCIPIMVIVMIICGHFRPTRPIAILLSSDGEIDLQTEAKASP